MLTLENGGVDVDDDDRGDGEVEESVLPAVRLHQAHGGGEDKEDNHQGEADQEQVCSLTHFLSS